MFFKKRLLTETEFAVKFAKKLIKKVNDLKIISIEELHVKTQLNGVEHQYFLNNAYSEYLMDSKLIKETMEKYLQSASEAFKPKEAVNIENVFPVVKDMRFFNNLKELKPEFETKHIYEFYNEELVVFYAEDKEYSIQYISKEDLAAVDFPLESLREKAVENLQNHLKLERHGENGFYMITAGGNYESSLILLNIWHEENFPVNGDFVVGIPARDLLYVTGSRDSKNLHQLYDLIEKMNETGDHLVSDKIFEMRNGKFEIL
ncbi:DUF1444 family protein [Flavobacterium gelatinilyticum]|uniref:DUF1444 family protein n=1 Tax=Flavobacterium gelatinilyticum TaxID=3003260 RepID=UPI0024808EC5|nr:DUF1444 family protein [Flavobacterium gelatinilyticum]